MAAKSIIFDTNAREAMRRGVKTLAQAVKVTLGPSGRNVVIEKSFGSPTVTKDIAQVGASSANQDQQIGQMIADAMDKVGKDGVITIEEGKGLDTVVDLVEGLQFDKGYISPHFADPQTMEVNFEDAYILIHEEKVSSIKDLLPILGKVAEAGKSLLIISEDIEGEALATLVVNKLRGTLKVAAVKAP